MSLWRSPYCSLDDIWHLLRMQCTVPSQNVVSVPSSPTTFGLSYKTKRKFCEAIARKHGEAVITSLRATRQAHVRVCVEYIEFLVMALIVSAQYA